jgi:hypothetical protein
VIAPGAGSAAPPPFTPGSTVFPGAGAGAPPVVIPVGTVPRTSDAGLDDGGADD